MAFWNWRQGRLVRAKQVSRYWRTARTRSRRHAALRYEPLESRLAMTGVVISEFLASNGGGLADVDGDNSDWIELHNAGSEAVSLAGWYLTDSADNLTKWQLPSIELAADGYLVVFASNKNRAVAGQELHTNFALSADGEYLGLVLPDGVTIADAFVPQFPAQLSNVSYGKSDVAQVDTQLVGMSSDSSIHIPGNNSLGFQWTLDDFDDSAWLSGELGIGFDQSGSSPADAVASVSINNSVVPSYTITSGGMGEGALAYVDRVHVYRQVPQFLVGADVIRTSNDDKSTGSFSMNVSLDEISDVYLLIDNRVGDNNATTPPTLGGSVMPWVASMGFTNTGWQIGLDEGANGDVNNYVTVYVLSEVPAGTVLNLGAQNNGTARNMYGVAAVASRTSLEEYIETNVQMAMQGVSSSAYVRVPFAWDGSPADELALGIRYDDGFVAYLNGVEIARRNAPESLAYNSVATAARTAEEASLIETIDVSAFAHLLTDGENILAVHGLNISAADDSFLLAPTLTASALYEDVAQYFATPTPGAANGEGVFGVLGEVGFSIERGFYNEPIEVALTAPDPQSVIRYTVDGSVPTATNGLVYSGPIDVDTTTVVRAAAFRSGYLASATETHSYLFLADVIEQPVLPEGWPSTWGSWPLPHYEMSPDVVEDPVYHDRLLAGLRELPTLSLTMNLDEFLGTNGIYSNPLQSGGDWEAVVSAEMIGIDGLTQFQIDAGLRLQGGASREPNNTPKHSMSLRFRGEYGAGTLDYPLMPDSDVTVYDTLQLRAVYNNSWTHWLEDQRQRGQMIQDQWARDTMIAMGNPDGGHGVFTHVYINGLYWGVYNLHERPVADHYAQYYGGEKEDYDSVNGITLNDGTWEAWDEMQAIVASQNWGAIQQVVDIDNFIDFTIVQHFTGNQDLKVDGNWRAAGGGVGRAPWRFYVWDAERTLENPSQVGVGPASDPTGLWLHLSTMPEFRLRFADRVQEHFFNDGALTPENTISRYEARAEEVDQAIIAESARWGSYRVDVAPRGGPGELYTRDDQWEQELTRLVENYFPVRTANVLTNFINEGLFPNLSAPLMSHLGGTVESGFELSLSKPGGSPSGAVIYYTLDGSDPRLEGGAVNTGSAQVYSGSLTLEESTQVRARMFDAGTWSAIVDAEFNVLAPPNELPGDYDGNLVVDAADYQVWKGSFGATIAVGTGADGNGDGVVNLADYTIWRDNLGASLLPAPDYSFTEIGQTYTQDFDAFRGTAETLPPHYTVTVVEGTDVYRGVFDSTTAAASSFTGIMGTTSDGEDYSFAWRESTGAAGLADTRVLFTFTNNTGEAITGFNISYDVEAWVNGRRDNQLRFKYDVYADSEAAQSAVGRNAFESDIFATLNPNHTAIAANGDQFVLDGKNPANRVTVSGYVDLAMLAVDESNPGLGTFGALQPGETAYFRWQISNGALADGNRSALGFDNLSITALATAPVSALGLASTPVPTATEAQASVESVPVAGRVATLNSRIPSETLGPKSLVDSTAASFEADDSSDYLLLLATAFSEADSEFGGSKISSVDTSLEAEPDLLLGLDLVFAQLGEDSSLVLLRS
ncbi:chitobiase/beta-hexosaminidase C-terminal domain-containing protein [Aeoliella sp. SH292]|uniref:chitobiase/beta-hexosaminidase C-terminal domain-containing protein n=1 Tax=Aeoliella sp. SH292 TaxID=3454464 RepID=UPI003F9DF88A